MLLYKQYVRLRYHLIEMKSCLKKSVDFVIHYF